MSPPERGRHNFQRWMQLVLITHVVDILISDYK
jgi:hypothetical protein